MFYLRIFYNDNIEHMKRFSKKCIVILIPLLYCGYGMSLNDDDIKLIFNELSDETAQVVAHYQVQYVDLQSQLNNNLNTLNTANKDTEKLNVLISCRLIEEQIKVLKFNEASEISKIRYLKGLQIMRILYEKTLALDHHFASVSTFNEINKLSNPNQYPEFIKMKENLSTFSEKKKGFGLNGILGENIYTSILHSFITLFNNESITKNEKEENLAKVECILDFTLRMHNDLNTIYFETAFLQKSNENVMEELQQLFVDYTKPIKYNTALKECRNTDDWDRIRENLGVYLEALDRASKDSSTKYKAHKMQINLEFPIDRLLQFIIQYNTFIDQGSKFYEKFGIMLNSYEHEQQCANNIPIGYNKLKENINIAIQKFNTAYKPIEINGSKMKEILYGINEYD